MLKLFTAGLLLLSSLGLMAAEKKEVLADNAITFTYPLPMGTFLPMDKASGNYSTNQCSPTVAVVVKDSCGTVVGTYPCTLTPDKCFPGTGTWRMTNATTLPVAAGYTFRVAIVGTLAQSSVVDVTALPCP